jgi:phosphonate transport system substrate-binding protein
MIGRRLLLSLALLASIAGARGAAADWRAQYPEINFAVVPAENEATVTNRWTRLSRTWAKNWA